MTVVYYHWIWGSHAGKYSVNNKKRNQMNKIGHPKIGHVRFIQIISVYQKQYQGNDTIHQSVSFNGIKNNSKQTNKDKKVLDEFLKWFNKINLDIGLDTRINKHTGIRYNKEE